MKQLGDFEVAQLLEFTKHQDFAVGAFEFSHGLTQGNFGGGGGLRCGFAKRGGCAEERGAKCSFAAMRAKNFESNGVEVGSEECGGFVTGRGANYSHESFLRQFLSEGRIGDATAEKSEEWLLVTREESVEGFGGAAGKGEHELLVGFGE